MRWEKLQIQGGGGPGRRWGHTCNAVRGGNLLYVFGGYGNRSCQTNQVHVFDTVNGTWSEPAMKGIPPIPRDSHTCTTVGENLFVFGGTDGRNPLNDLHILDTYSNTWISPTVQGDGPEAREGHSAALVGKRLFIFGGCGKSENSEIYYDDLYILNTETFSWKHVVPSGAPPTKRDSHTCSSWKNKIIVIGGEDSCDYYLSDVHILDADSLIWCKLNTTGQLLPPRAGHTTVAFGKNLFVFGGFSDEQNLYDDIYMLNIETGIWTKVIATGDSPSPRFSMAGECLDPQMQGVLVFIGGCNKNLEALDDMYYLHTGLVREIERDERRVEKLSLRKQLKLKCQEQHTLVPSYDNALVRFENNVHKAIPVSSYAQPGRQNVNPNEDQTPIGKRTFQAKVTKSFPDGYTIETVIDGKPLRGVLFSNKPGFIKQTGDSTNSFPMIAIVLYRSHTMKAEAVKTEGTNLNADDISSFDIARTLEPKVRDVKQPGAVHRKNSAVSEPRTEAAPAEMKDLAPSNAPLPQEANEAPKPSVESDVAMESNENDDASHSGSETPKENASRAEEFVTQSSS